MEGCPTGRWVVTAAAALVVVLAAPVRAASVLVDLTEAEILEEADQSAPVALGRTLDYGPGTLEADQTVGELVLEHNGRIVGAIPLVAPVSIAPERLVRHRVPVDRRAGP